MKKILILGSTGSIGRQTLEVISRQEGMRVYGLSSYSNTALLKKQIKRWRPEVVWVKEKKTAGELSRKFGFIKLFHGDEGLKEIVRTDCDLVLLSITGFSALFPLLS